MEFPKASDEIFVEATGVNYDYASINRNKGSLNDNGLFLIIEGYREASLFLINDLIERHNDDWLKIDSIIYPILFNFRHYLEIVMKDTLRYHRMLNAETYATQVGFRNEHSLLSIWLELRPYLDKVYETEGDTKETHDAVEKLIIEFDNKDKGSYSFRYPFESSRKPEVDIKYSTAPFTIDLKNLKRVFESLTHFFDSVNNHALVLLEQSSDYE